MRARARSHARPRRRTTGGVSWSALSLHGPTSRLLQFVTVDEHRRLEEYENVTYVAPAVRDLRAEAARLMPHLAGRTVWLVNSTARGGGVAEMLPPLVAVLRELGVRTEWVVIDSHEQEFFRLTKHLHNLIHGEGEPRLGRADRELFERVN